MIVIGITGTLGAGKGTIVEYLVNHKNFTHYSVREFLTHEIEKRNMPVNRDSMVIVANDLRARHAPSYVTDQLYYQALKTDKNCVIESIRTPGEIDSLREKGNFFLFAVDAPSTIRYERILIRNSETDRIDYPTFIQNEAREMHTSDPNKQNLRKCIEMADFVFENTASVDELHMAVEKVLHKIVK
jgi:dephospho-CoA kinase